MMKVVLLCFVFTSLVFVAAGIRSPPPSIEINPGKNVIVNDVHSIQYGGKSKHVLSEITVGAERKIKHTMRKMLETVADAVKGKAEAGEPTVIKAAKDAAQVTKENVEEVFKTGYTLQKDVRSNSTEYFLPILPRSYTWVTSSTKLLGLSLAYGTTVWVTFISSYVSADVLPRQQFAALQCKLYTVYFRVMASGIGMALLSHCLSSETGLSSIQALNLIFTLLVVLFNLKFMEPRANKLMFDTMKLEKEEGRGAERPTDEPSVVRNIDSLIAPLSGRSRSSKASANPSEIPEERADSSSGTRSEMVNMSERMKKLNFYSSVLNIVVLVSLTFHLIHLGKNQV